MQAKPQQNPPESRENTGDFYDVQQVARTAQGVSGLAIICLAETRAGARDPRPRDHPHICSAISASAVVPRFPSP